VHIVALRFKDGADQVRIAALFDSIAALKSQIPGILDTVFGKNFSLRSPQFTHVVTMHFVDRNALDAFYTHPVHQRLITN
jgi:Stress responsive A/B Barrel Domain